MSQSSVEHAAGAPGAPGMPGMPDMVDTVSVMDAATAEERQGSEYLLFTCRGIACAVPLRELREVLRMVPPHVRIPFSPTWLLGVFTLRTELLGLVDPAPMLLGAAWTALEPAPLVAALIVGYNEPLLGLAVGPVGEIVAIRPDEIAPSQPPDDSSVAPTYVRGRYHPAGSATSYAVLDVAPFVAALLRALREGTDHA